jgi:hypothetical protein
MRCTLDWNKAEIDSEHVYNDLCRKIPKKDLLKQVKVLFLTVAEPLVWLDFTELEELDLDDDGDDEENKSDTMPYLFHLLERNPHLQSLTISEYRDVSDKFEEALSRLPNLRHLFIGGSVYLDLSKCYQIRDLTADLTSFSCLRTMHHLKRVFVSDLTDILSDFDTSSERLENFSTGFHYEVPPNITDILARNKLLNENRRKVKTILIALIRFFIKDVMNEIIKEI